VIVGTAALVAAIPLTAWTVVAERPGAQAAAVTPAPTSHVPTNPVEARSRTDFAAMQTSRPGYAFWQHVFTMPYGRIAFVRARYFLGSKLARELRALPGKEYEDVYRSYAPRSHLYAEMVFGNTFIVRDLIASTPQAPIHAMRVPRATSLAEIVTRTGLPANEVRRFNPALVERVPAHTTLYLPHHVRDFGPDVAFWRRPPSPSYTAVLNDFLRLDGGPERWDHPDFAPTLTDFKRRFKETNTEEGVVMETVLAYVMDQAYTSSRRALLSEFRSSGQVRRLIDRGVLELKVTRVLEAGGLAPLLANP
jgi:hypothetical protein